MPPARLAALKKSTIVRSFWLLERVAPGVGARWAERLWFAIPRARGPRDRLAVPGRAFRVAVDGHTVRGEVWGPDPDPGDPAPGDPVPAVYLVHGWGGWRGQLDPFVGPLV
jgi:hypothetical protein